MDTSPDFTVQDWIGYQPAPQRYEYTPDNPPEVARHIASLIQEKSRVLDVGCGTGALGEYLQIQLQATVVGVEPNAERTARARERGIEAHEGYLAESMLDDLGLFDVVIFADVLEHCANPGDLLRLALKFLKPEGRIVISVPNVAHWSIRNELLWGHFDYEELGIQDATHLRWFTRESLTRFVQNVGFRVIQMKYCANTGLPAYRTSFYFRYMPDRIMKKLVAWGIKRLPTWFACQLVVSIERGTVSPDAAQK
ncbi:MAG: class I SAM-dependent methyltransferase [Planctomycetaceae bacterium]|nr:class I SAM-dependent methyltransferase [Planctomycetaceae bacterium]